jgi:hypothetical protein
MPYIITTTIPGCGSPCGGEPECERVIDTRFAVATLEEAREHCFDLIGQTLTTEAEHQAGAVCATDAYEITEHGGSIGPLPDGTMIEVAPTTWAELVNAPGFRLGVLSEHRRARIIDAYNAAQGS